MCALSIIGGSSELAAYYERRVAAGKPKKWVINALRNKLIHRVYACIREDRLYKKKVVKTTQDAEKTTQVVLLPKAHHINPSQCKSP